MPGGQLNAEHEMISMYRNIKTHEELVHSSSDAREQQRDLVHGVRRTRGWDRGYYYHWERPSERRKCRCIHLRYSHFAAVA